MFRENSIETSMPSSVKQITSPGWMHETGAQNALGRCTGKTQRDGMGRDLGGGIGMGNTCKSLSYSCQCTAKTLQYCKVVNLQLIKINEKKIDHWKHAVDHHFEIHARLLEDKAKTNTRQLKTVEQKRIRLDCGNIGQIQSNNPQIRKHFSLLLLLPFSLCQEDSTTSAYSFMKRRQTPHCGVINSVYCLN